MNLTKFLRRYSRVLLMVFMSLLLIVFLIGDVLTRAAQSAANPKHKIGEAFGADLYSTDLQNAHNKQELIAQMGFREIGMLADPLDIYLLMEEARRAGIQVGRAQVKSILPRKGVNDLWLKQLQERYGISYNEMYDFAAEWLAVELLFMVQLDALDNSLPRAELAFRDNNQQADVTLSVIDSNAFVSSMPIPTERELQDFFEQTKDRETNHTEDELQFGCVLPDRIRIEYLTVNPRRIESKVHIREREAKRYYEEHIADYTIPVATPVSPVTSQYASEVQMTYEEARARVRRDCRAAKAIQEAQSLMNEIRHTAYQPWQTQPRDEQGFRQSPPPETLASFDSLRERFSEQYEVIYEQTELLGRVELLRLFDPRPEYMRREEARKTQLEPLYIEGATQIPLSDFALRVEGIVSPDPNDTSPVLRPLEPSPVLMSFRTPPGTQQPVPYQYFIFRVVATEPLGPPDSLDIVRAQLVEDYRLLKAHEYAGEQARRVGTLAREVGLAAALEQTPALTKQLSETETAAASPTGPFELGFRPPPAPEYVNALGPNKPSLPFTRNTAVVQWVGQTRKLPREVFALAEPDSQKSTGTHNVAVIEVADLLKWVIVELEQVKPLYAGEFDQQRATLLGRPASDLRWPLQMNWFARDNVRQRCGFVRAVAGQDSEPAEQ